MQDPARSRIDRLAPRAALAAIAIAASIGVLAGCGESAKPTSDVTSSASQKKPDANGNIPEGPFLWAKTVMSHQGYAPVNPDQYSASSNLRFMVGRTSPTKMKVFFFLGDDRWLGTDTKDPSMTVSVAHSDNESVQVTYGLYKPDDLDNKPSGGTKTVTFKWNGSKLEPLDEIPPSSETAELSRR